MKPLLLPVALDVEAAAQVELAAHHQPALQGHLPAPAQSLRLVRLPGDLFPAHGHLSEGDGHVMQLGTSPVVRLTGSGLRILVAVEIGLVPQLEVPHAIRCGTERPCEVAGHGPECCHDPGVSGIHGIERLVLACRVALPGGGEFHSVWLLAHLGTR